MTSASELVLPTSVRTGLDGIEEQGLPCKLIWRSYRDFCACWEA